MNRLRRAFATASMGLLLMAGTAIAQELEPIDGGGGTSGNPLYGYVATAFLAAGAIFVLCKSSRR